MIGQVGGNYMKARRDVAIFKDMPILASIRSRRVLAYQRNSLARLFDIDAVLDAVQFKINITGYNV